MKRFTMFAAAAALSLTGASGVHAQDPEMLGGHPNLNGVWQVKRMAVQRWCGRPTAPSMPRRSQGCSVCESRDTRKTLVVLCAVSR